MKSDIDVVELSRFIRKKCLVLGHSVGRKGAHFGGGLSAVEILSTLYSSIMDYDFQNPFREDRDRLIISKGHCVLAYYSLLHHFGLLSDLQYSEFETDGGYLHGHATRNLGDGIEFSGGSLSMGMPYAVGVAIGLKKKSISNKVYCVIGDGECDEGLIWEAAMSASNFKLDNFVLIVDCNKVQYDGFTVDLMDKLSLADKFTSFGFSAIQCDGHDVNDLADSLVKSDVDKPLVVIAHTIKGKGVSFMEQVPGWHHNYLSDEMLEIAMREQDVR